MSSISETAPKKNSLNSDHAAHLAQFGITPELLEEARVSSETDTDVRELMGLNGGFQGESLGGIYFRYESPVTGQRTGARVRLDVPLLAGGKYISERQSRGFYYPPGASAVLGNTAVPVVIVEAEKSVLAETAFAERTGRRLLAVGIGGCWGWRRRVGKRPLPDGGTEPETGPGPDFDVITWTGRTVVVMLDSNARTNRSVRAARGALVKELTARGAEVLVAELPESVNGPDDLIRDQGDGAMLAVIEAALPAVIALKTDGGNADRYALEHSDSVKWSSEHEAWFAYDGKRWKRNAIGEVMRRARLTVARMWDDVKAATDETKKKQLVKWALHADSKSGLEAMVSLARWHEDVEILKFDDVFDRDPLLLNCTNGILDLRTGKLGLHRKDAMLTKMAGVSYDPNLLATRFTGFLCKTFGGSGDAEADLALIEYVQRLAGYFLTGLTAEQAIYLFFGPSETGKSTIVKIIRRVMGEYATSLPDGALLAKKFADDDEHAAADLPGVRLATAVETAPGRRLNEQKIKQITGQDFVRARHLYENSFEFRPQAKLVIATNHLPTVKDTDESIWRRIKVVEFHHIVPPNEKVKDIDEVLIEAEGSGILRWMVEGSMKYLADGLQEPERVTKAIRTYREAQDEVQEWVNECCVREGSTTTKDLYASFVDWAKTGGTKYPITKTRLGIELKRLGFASNRTGGSSKWDGIRIKGLLETG